MKGGEHKFEPRVELVLDLFPISEVCFRILSEFALLRIADYRLLDHVTPQGNFGRATVQVKLDPPGPALLWA